MNRRLRVGVLVAWCAAHFLGCAQPKPRHYLGEADLNYYLDKATSIEYPNVATMPNEAALASDKPPTVREPTEIDSPWEMTLQEALELALANTKVIKSRTAFKTPGNLVLANPDRVSTSYDAAIQETNTNFFQRGPEAALSAFDTTFNLSMDLGHNEMIQNNALLGGGILGGGALESDTARMQSNLQKIFANGDSFKISNNWNYLATNQPLQLFPGYYQAAIQAQYRHPLLAGAGAEYTAIAGPIARTPPQLGIFDQGVLIARINTDITLADFELNLTNLVRDVEDQYWELYLAYRTYDAERKARDAAHSFWQTTKARVEAGTRLRGGAVDEGQARENYFSTRARVENAVAALYNAEAQLRRLLGLPVNDGRFIRPSDEPLASEYVSDWTYALTESLSRRVELRRQKWQIKSFELQLRAAESLTRPRLDFVGSYQQNGFGEHLFGDNDSDGSRAEQYQGAYNTLFEGNQASWDVGFEFSMPIGFRQAMAQKRNLELKLTKARAVLASQEHEISHELGNTFAMIDMWYQLAETNFDRYIASQRQLEAVEREFDAGRIPIDLLLRSQASVAAAETAYYTALTRYNQTITDLRLRKGSLLEENSIFLAEGGWTQEAREDALRRAWARSFAKENPYLKDRTEPLVAPPAWPAGHVVPAGHALPQMPTPPPADLPGMPTPEPEIDAAGTSGFQKLSADEN